MAMAVRKPLPMSCAPEKHSTEPSRWMRISQPTLAAAGVHAPFAVRHADAALLRPLASPAFLLRRSQPMAFAPMSYCIWRTGEGSFFFRSSSGSIWSFSASSSIADSRAKAPCGCPGARRGAAGPGVGEDAVILAEDVRRVLVQVGERGRGASTRGDARGSEGTVMDRGEGAVLLRSDVDGDERRGRVARAQVLLLAVEHELDRSARGLREAARDHRELAARGRGCELAAETAAHMLGDHADLGARNPEGLGDAFLDREDALGRGVDRELVAVPLRDHAVGFERRVGVNGNPVRALDAHVRGRESGRRHRRASSRGRSAARGCFHCGESARFPAPARASRPAGRPASIAFSRSVMNGFSL